MTETSRYQTSRYPMDGELTPHRCRVDGHRAAGHRAAGHRATGQGTAAGRTWPARALFVRALLVALSVPMLAGCGVVRSTAALQDASSAYEVAREAGAAKRARYEFTLGVEYLRKAQEEAGYSDYSTSERLARQSIGFLKKATAVAGGKELAPEEESRGPVDDEESLPEE